MPEEVGAELIAEELFAETAGEAFAADAFATAGTEAALSAGIGTAGGTAAEGILAEAGTEAALSAGIGTAGGTAAEGVFADAGTEAALSAGIGTAGGDATALGAAPISGDAVVAADNAMATAGSTIPEAGGGLTPVTIPPSTPVKGVDLTTSQAVRNTAASGASVGGGAGGETPFLSAPPGADPSWGDSWGGSVDNPGASGVADKLAGAGDAALKYGPLALGAYGQLNASAVAKQIAASNKKAGVPESVGSVGAPQRAVGQSMLEQATAGKINPSDQFAIDQWKQSAIAQARQYYAKAGLSDSDMAKKAESDIAAKAVAMQEEARQKLLQTGLSTLNGVDQYQVAAINAEMSADANTSKQANDFLQSYGQWLRVLPTMKGGAETPAPK